MTKFSDNLCTKCVKCPAGKIAQIDQRKGENCLKFNCYVICDGMKDDKLAAHALTHELFHRVVSQGPAGEIYRGQAGYPLPPTSAENADPYASLIDDLLPATPAKLPRLRLQRRHLPGSDPGSIRAPRANPVAKYLSRLRSVDWRN
jgi:hypothetical protein